MADIIDDLKKNMAEQGVLAAMATKEYSSEVRTALISFGPDALIDMNSIDNNTFGAKAKNPAGVPDAQMALFNQADQAIKALGRKDVVFATTAAEQYRKLGHDEYERKTRNFANAIYTDPETARKVIELANAGKVSELSKIAKDPGGYMQALHAPKPDAGKDKKDEHALPATQVASTGAAKPQTNKPVVGNRQQQLDRIHKLANGESGTANEEVIGGEVIQDHGDDANLTPEQATARLNNILANPNSPLGKKIKSDPSLEKDLRARIEAHPNMVRNFESPKTQEMYLKLLNQGKTDTFLDEFGVSPVATVASVSGGMTGITGGFKDVLNMLKGVVPGAGGFLDNISNKLEGGMGFISRLADSFGNKGPGDVAMAASMGTGQQIKKLLESGDPAQIAYGQDVLRDAQLAATANSNGQIDAKHQALVNHTSNVLKGVGLNSSQIKDMMQYGGNVHVSLVKNDKTGMKEVHPDVVVASSMEDLIQKIDPQVERFKDNVVNNPDPRAAAEIERERQREQQMQAQMQPAGPQGGGVETFPIK